MKILYKLLLLNLYFLLILVLTSAVLNFFSFPMQAEYKLNYNTQVRTSPANLKGSVSGSVGMAFCYLAFSYKNVAVYYRPVIKDLKFQLISVKSIIAQVVEAHSFLFR